MQKDLHLITKIVFDPEYFYPERFIKIKTGDYISNGIIVSNDEEEITVVCIRKILIEDVSKREPFTQTIHSEQVVNGDIELIFPEETKTDPESFDKLYVAFRDTSDCLRQKECELSKLTSTEDEPDALKRHNSRIKAFRELISKAKQQS